MAILACLPVSQNGWSLCRQGMTPAGIARLQTSTNERMVRMQLMRFVSSHVQQAVLVAFIAAGCVTMTASAQKVYNNGTGTNNGYYYSLYSSGGSATMTLGSAGNYAITWSGVSDVVGGKGWSTGSSRTVNYNVGYATGYNNISVYGWTTSPLVEYYICELGSLYTGNATYKGSVTSDGHTYKTYLHQQVNQPSIVGTATFNQYLDNWGGSSTGSNHAVTTGNHFTHWKNLGMSMGTFNYQILGTEAYNNATGSVNATVW
jgi:endo-1,4-beta-xylanase